MHPADVSPVDAPRPLGLRGVGRQRIVGFLLALLTAACWGASPIFIRMGLDGFPSPMWSVTIGLGAAAATFVAWMAVAKPRSEHPLARWGRMRIPLRLALFFIVLGGLGSTLGAVARTIAIDLIPVVVAAPLVQTTSLWTLIFAPLLLGRHVERVTPKLVFGAVLVVGGASLVIVGLNV